jgi:lysophospholipase L1-like esterase
MLRRAFAAGIFNRGASAPAEPTYETPAYENAGGTGDRTATLTVTLSPTLSTFTGSDLINGSTANSTYPNDGIPALGESIIIAFGSKRKITEITFHLSGAVSGGVWQPKAYIDGTWSNCGDSFTLGTSAPQVITVDATGATKIGFFGVSGTTDWNAYWQEVEFKIANITLDASATPTTYNLTSGLSVWNTRKTQNKAVYLVSNSVGAGAGADTPATTGWFAKLIAQLKVVHGDGGSFIGYWADSVAVDETTQWTLGAGWAENPNAIHKGVGNATDAGAAEISLTGRYFDIYSYAGATTPAYSVAFDGAAADAVGSATGNLHHVINTLDKGQATHALSITRGAGGAYNNGIAARTGTGIYGINSSASGAQLETPGSWVSVSILQQLLVMEPALVVIHHGINEFRNDVDPVTFQANLDTWCAKVRAYTDASILIVSQNPVDETNTYAQTLYNDAMYAVARKYQTAFIDIQALMGGTFAAAHTAGYMGADAVHPIQAGHDFIYSTVLGVL